MRAEERAIKYSTSVVHQMAISYPKSSVAILAQKAWQAIQQDAKGDLPGCVIEPFGKAVESDRLESYFFVIFVAAVYSETFRTALIKNSIVDETLKFLAILEVQFDYLVMGTRDAYALCQNADGSDRLYLTYYDFVESILTLLRTL